VTIFLSREGERGIHPRLSTFTKEFVMPNTTRVSVLIAVSAMLLFGCGGDSGAESGNGMSANEAKKGCTERDGAWFGRLDDGKRIISQTREACEERL
jgi:hypothetical protein